MEANTDTHDDEPGGLHETLRTLIVKGIADAARQEFLFNTLTAFEQGELIPRYGDLARVLPQCITLAQTWRLPPAGLLSDLSECLRLFKLELVRHPGVFRESAPGVMQAMVHSVARQPILAFFIFQVPRKRQRVIHRWRTLVLCAWTLSGFDLDDIRVIKATRHLRWACRDIDTDRAPLLDVLPGLPDGNASLDDLLSALRIQKAHPDTNENRFKMLLSLEGIVAWLHEHDQVTPGLDRARLPSQLIDATPDGHLHLTTNDAQERAPIFEALEFDFELTPEGLAQRAEDSLRHRALRERALPFHTTALNPLEHDAFIRSNTKLGRSTSREKKIVSLILDLVWATACPVKDVMAMTVGGHNADLPRHGVFRRTVPQPLNAEVPRADRADLYQADGQYIELTLPDRTHTLLRELVLETHGTSLESCLGLSSDEVTMAIDKQLKRWRLNGWRRLTLARIQRSLATRIQALAGDAALTWMLTAAPDDGPPPHTYYMNLPIEQLSELYRQATGRLPSPGQYP